jgi:hypothetical protein
MTMVAQYTPTTARSGAGVAARILFTLVGAAGLIVGALLDWWNGMIGTDLTDKVLYQTSFTKADKLVSSIGAVSILLGLVAVVGLVAASGWLTRLAGALGVVMFVLFAIQGYRLLSSVSTEANQIGAGAWIALGGAVVAVIAGFLGRPAVVVAAPRTIPEDEV